MAWGHWAEGKGVESRARGVAWEESRLEARSGAGSGRGPGARRLRRGRTFGAALSPAPAASLEAAHRRGGSSESPACSEPAGPRPALGRRDVLHR